MTLTSLSYNYLNTIFCLPFLQTKMILNLNKPNTNKQPQNNLMSSQSFLIKNKITINEVTHTHFTVEGVQMYSPAQIQALKQTQQRIKPIQNKQPVQVKVYQIQEYFDQFQQSKQLNPKQKVQELLRTKYGKDLAKSSAIDKADTKSQNNLTVKQKVTQNKMALTKLEKQRNKKTVLQNKLAQLSKHYKQYFSSSNQQPQKSNLFSNKLEQSKSLVQSIHKITKVNQKDDSQEQQTQIQNYEQKTNNKNSPFAKNSKKALSNSSTKYTKLTNKQAKKSEQGNKKEGHSQIVDFLDGQEGVNMLEEIASNKSTYSQKLGSAVHLLFN